MLLGVTSLTYPGFCSCICFWRGRALCVICSARRERRQETKGRRAFTQSNGGTTFPWLSPGLRGVEPSKLRAVRGFEGGEMGRGAHPLANWH